MVAKRNVSVRSGFGSFLSSPIASSTLIIVGICVLQAVYSIYSSKDRTVRLVEGLLEEGEVAREQMEAMTEMDSSKLEANSTENLSRGADVNRNDTTQGTLQKFFSQEENGREAPTQVKCEDPATERLCAAVFRLAKKYKTTALLDASCVRNAGWMPEVITQLQVSQPTFRFVCVGGNASEVETMKDRFSRLENVEFIAAEWWRMTIPASSDLILMWDELSHVMYGRSWAFLAAVRKSDARLLLLDNYPTVINEPSTTKTQLNIRRHPFLFPSAKETVYNVTEPGDTKSRQLLLYEVRSIPQALLS